MKKETILKELSLLNISILGLSMMLPAFYWTQKAQAANLAFTMVRLDRMSASTATGGTVCVKPLTVASTEGKVVVTFPSDFTLNATASNWTSDITPNSSWPTGAIAWAGLTSPATVADNGAKTVTFASGDLASGSSIYCFNFSGTTTLTTGSAGISKTGSVATQTGASAAIDSSNYALAVIANDQVQVTGTVNPTFSFTLSSTSANFISIGNSVANTSSNPTVTIVTNARNGWTTWVKDANDGTLTSAGTGSNIPNAGTVGTSYNLGDAGHIASGGFGLGITTTGGSSAPTTEYSGVSAGYAGRLSNAFRPAATSTAFASSDVITLLPRAIASVTQAPANDYTDTITIVGAGQF